MSLRSSFYENSQIKTQTLPPKANAHIVNHEFITPCAGSLAAVSLSSELIDQIPHSCKDDHGHYHLFCPLRLLFLTLSSSFEPRNAPARVPMRPWPWLLPNMCPPTPPATAPKKPRSPSWGLFGSAGSRSYPYGLFGSPDGGGPVDAELVGCADST